MKILGILGSPHRKYGATGKLMLRFLESAEKNGAETELAVLSDLQIGYCAGCAQCHIVGSCPQKDDALEIKRKMREADGIVLGSPVYISGPTAQMKTLLDRCSPEVHCLFLGGKYGASISTSGGMKEETTAQYLEEFLRRCGVLTVGHVYTYGQELATQGGKVLERVDALAQELTKAIEERRDYPQFHEEMNSFKERMKELMTHRKNEYTYEYEYWKGIGWL